MATSVSAVLPHPPPPSTTAGAIFRVDWRNVHTLLQRAVGNETTPSAPRDEASAQQQFCTNCRADDHTRADCPHPARCYVCLQPGHEAFSCVANPAPGSCAFIEEATCDICHESGHRGTNCKAPGGPHHGRPGTQYARGSVYPRPLVVHVGSNVGPTAREQKQARDDIAASIPKHLRQRYLQGEMSDAELFAAGLAAMEGAGEQAMPPGGASGITPPSSGGGGSNFTSVTSAAMAAAAESAAIAQRQRERLLRGLLALRSVVASHHVPSERPGIVQPDNESQSQPSLHELKLATSDFHVVFGGRVERYRRTSGGAVAANMDRSIDMVRNTAVCSTEEIASRMPFVPSLGRDPEEGTNHTGQRRRAAEPPKEGDPRRSRGETPSGGLSRRRPVVRVNTSSGGKGRIEALLERVLTTDDVAGGDSPGLMFQPYHSFTEATPSVAGGRTKSEALTNQRVAIAMSLRRQWSASVATQNNKQGQSLQDHLESGDCRMSNRFPARVVAKAQQGLSPATTPRPSSGTAAKQTGEPSFVTQPTAEPDHDAAGGGCAVEQHDSSSPTAPTGGAAPPVKPIRNWTVYRALNMDAAHDAMSVVTNQGSASPKKPGDSSPSAEAARRLLTLKGRYMKTKLILNYNTLSLLDARESHRAVVLKTPSAVAAVATGALEKGRQWSVAHLASSTPRSRPPSPPASGDELPSSSMWSARCLSMAMDEVAGQICSGIHRAVEQYLDRVKGPRGDEASAIVDAFRRVITTYHASPRRPPGTTAHQQQQQQQAFDMSDADRVLVLTLDAAFSDRAPHKQRGEARTLEGQRLLQLIRYVLHEAASGRAV